MFNVVVLHVYYALLVPTGFLLALVMLAGGESARVKFSELTMVTRKH